MLERVPDVKATPKPERCVRPAPAADAGRPTVHRDGWQRVGARAPDHAGHAPRAAATPASPGAWRVRPRRALGRHAPSHQRPLNAHTRPEVDGSIGAHGRTSRSAPHRPPALRTTRTCSRARPARRSRVQRRIPGTSRPRHPQTRPRVADQIAGGAPVDCRPGPGRPRSARPWPAAVSVLETSQGSLGWSAAVTTGQSVILDAERPPLSHDGSRRRWLVVRFRSVELQDGTRHVRRRRGRG